MLEGWGHPFEKQNRSFGAERSGLVLGPASCVAYGISVEYSKYGGSGMRVFKSTEVAKRFGAISQIVQSEPVCVESHGRPQMVMLSPAEYERLRRQDRRVYATSELPASLRAAIAAARPSAEAATFNDEA